VTRLRAFLVDDEPPALARLARLLETTGRAEIAGSATDAEEALAAIAATTPDALFLDIQMPGANGFELVARLPAAAPPWVVFTTAHDRHALSAFAANAIDYLLKPVRGPDLGRALDKLERLAALPAAERAARAADQRRRLDAALPDRVASRVGDRVRLVELARVSHFRAEDKYVWAITDDGEHPLDETLAQLEGRLGERGFLRVHRGVLVNLAYVDELRGGAGDGLRLRLKDRRHTELLVARDRVVQVKRRLGVR
jgi:two-component system, LytTR family, response regulator